MMILGTSIDLSSHNICWYIYINTKKIIKHWNAVFLDILSVIKKYQDKLLISKFK